MAVAVDAVSFDKVNGTAATFAHTCTGANLVLYVHVGERFASAITGVTYNGVAMSQINYNDPGGNLVVDKWFRLLAPATGANNVVVSASAAHNFAVTAISLTGVDQTTPNGSVVNTNNGGGASTAISSGVVTSAAGEFVLDGATIMENTAGTATLAVGAGQTQRSNQEQVGGGQGIVTATSTEAGAASVTMSWTASVASYWVQSAFAVHAASGDTTAPANAVVAADEAVGGTQVGLTITMPADVDLDQYEIRRLTTGFPLSDRSNGTVIVAPTATSPSVTVNFTDSGLTNGLRYFYRVFLKDATGNWNTGTTASEVAATPPTVVGWYTSAGTFMANGETGANPIFEWTTTVANVETAKPVPFKFAVGSDNPGPNQEPTQDLLEFASANTSTFTAGSFKYFSGGAWATVPLLGVPWATVNAGNVTCRFYSQLTANQNLYGVVRVEQV